MPIQAVLPNETMPVYVRSLEIPAFIAEARVAPLGANEYLWARLITTGHGWSGTDPYSCAEFCRMNYTLFVNGKALASRIPFKECSNNPFGPPQLGTWKFARNGWSARTLFV